MNRRQEIAAWVFGVLIALGLLVTGNVIWALLVFAALTILSLRDRHLRSQKSTVQADSSHAEEAIESEPKFTLKNLTPHLLATSMLQRRAGGEVPFGVWRQEGVEIPPGADEIVAIACEFYQLRIFLDTLKRRFGAGIAKLVETSFASILDDVRGLSMFSRVNDAISLARGLGPAEDGPEDKALRMDLQVADQYLSLYSDDEGQKQNTRLPLAMCLGYARISAELTFSGLIAKIDFDPLSVAMVKRETEYRGTTSRWSETPGCFERHLQRKEDNALFPPSEREPTDEAVQEARAKDDAELKLLKTEMDVLYRTAENFTRQQTVSSIRGFQTDTLDPLMRRAAAIGEQGRKFLDALRGVDDSVFETIGDAAKGKVQDNEMKDFAEALRNAKRAETNLFLAQAWRSDTPITGADYISALLCESTEVIREVAEFLKEHKPDDVHDLYVSCAALLQTASEEEFALPGADEKLAMLKACSVNSKLAATTR